MAALACGCSHTGPAGPAEAAYGAHIETNTPPGLRAKQTVDMLNSDWPIGVPGVSTLAAAPQVDDIAFVMDKMWWDRPFTVSGIDYGAGQATLHLLTSYGVGQDIELRTNDAGMVDRFKVTLQKATITQWADVDAQLTKSGAHYSYQVSKITDGTCTKVAGSNVDDSLPLASIFKLYVLLGVADAVNAGTLGWDDQLTITKEAKAVGSAGFDHLPPGARVSVRDAAQQMISASDNMATDLLMARLGPGAVERALVHAGHHDPASMTPFPNTHELFSVGWGEPDLREQWKSASPRDRAAIIAQTNTRHYEPDPERTHTPASPYGAEWYGTAGDICRVHAALQTAAVGPAAPVRDILSATPGIDLDKTKWTYIGAKGGNLPGDIGFSWYAVDRTGQAWVVSFQANWPKFRSLTAASWLLSIAQGAFGLVQPA
ncbi:serine hydrolase [Mycobacterium hodleri]|uniref:Serine hydrolase n=1 Tax=Mycolicibacterium hodleri TaxID=49897 RepID=A0A544W506_9MYCO|nr:serine hydrolase [Mycolicibacterium hodleri]